MYSALRHEKLDSSVWIFGAIKVKSSEYIGLASAFCISYWLIIEEKCLLLCGSYKPVAMTLTQIECIDNAYAFLWNLFH